MGTYRIIIKSSLDPVWCTKLSKFWSAIKEAGINTDEKVLYIINEAQFDIVSSLAAEYGLSIKLVKTN